MTPVRTEPIEARVRWDRRGRRPAEIAWEGGSLHVVALTSVRDERAAYPAARGPRVTYLLETERGRARLVFDGRRGRWYVEALGANAA